MNDAYAALSRLANHRPDDFDLMTETYAPDGPLQIFEHHSIGWITLRHESAHAGERDPQAAWINLDVAALKVLRQRINALISSHEARNRREGEN